MLESFEFIINSGLLSYFAQIGPFELDPATRRSLDNALGLGGSRQKKHRTCCSAFPCSRRVAHRWTTLHITSHHFTSLHITSHHFTAVCAFWYRFTVMQSKLPGEAATGRQAEGSAFKELKGSWTFRHHRILLAINLNHAGMSRTPDVCFRSHCRR